ERPSTYPRRRRSWPGSGSARRWRYTAGACRHSLLSAHLAANFSEFRSADQPSAQRRNASDIPSKSRILRCSASAHAVVHQAAVRPGEGGPGGTHLRDLADTRSHHSLDEIVSRPGDQNAVPPLSVWTAAAP